MLTPRSMQYFIFVKKYRDNKLNIILVNLIYSKLIIYIKLPDKFYNTINSLNLSINTSILNHFLSIIMHSILQIFILYIVPQLINNSSSINIQTKNIIIYHQKS
jgi:hypothetical protein